MKLTLKQKDDLFVAIAEKYFPEILESVKQDSTEPKPKASKKPFPDAIGYEEGMDKIENFSDILDLMTVARMVEVKYSDLARVANSLSVTTVGRAKISLEDARLIWRTYCAKRKW